MNQSSVARVICIDEVEGVEDDTFAFMLQLYLDCIHRHNDLPPTAEVLEWLREHQPTSMETYKELLNRIEKAVDRSSLVEVLWKNPYRLSIKCMIFRGFAHIQIIEGKLKP